MPAQKGETRAEGKKPEEPGDLSVMQETNEQMRPFLRYTCSLLAGASVRRAAVHTGAGDCPWRHLERRGPLSQHILPVGPGGGTRKEKGKSCLGLCLVVADK